MTDLLLGVAGHPSIWGDVSGGQLRHDAADRWREDVRLMAELGIEAYRFAISWPRVEREGTTAYRDLADSLRAAGIQPLVTLHDGDLPRALADDGGWANRETVHAFAEYARSMARELGSRVSLWTTLDEPWSIAFLGHAAGVRPPHHTDAAEALAVAHHLNLAHGVATTAIRGELSEARVSVALNLHVTRPQDEQDSAHLEAVRAIDLVGNHVFLGPMLEGSYPVDLLALTRHLTDWSFVRPGDLAIARQRVDVLGVRHHATTIVRPGAAAARTDGAASPWPGAGQVEFVLPADHPPGRVFDPEGLRDLLRALGGVYPEVPLLVLEDGFALPDTVEVDDGRPVVHDQRRIEHLTAHLGEVERAIADGIDVRGYVLRSLLDAVDGTEGVAGIVHVDAAGDRVPKDSARWYADVIARYRAAQPDPAPPSPRRTFIDRLRRRGA